MNGQEVVLYFLMIGMEIIRKKGLKFSYAYLIMFSKDDIDLEQLSFGISGGLIQSQLDETSFLDSGVTDPIISGNVQNEMYANFDI